MPLPPLPFSICTTRDGSLAIIGAATVIPSLSAIPVEFEADYPVTRWLRSSSAVPSPEPEPVRDIVNRPRTKTGSCLAKCRSRYHEPAPEVFVMAVADRHHPLKQSPCRRPRVSPLVQLISRISLIAQDNEFQALQRSAPCTISYLRQLAQHEIRLFRADHNPIPTVPHRPFRTFTNRAPIELKCFYSLR